MKHGLGLIAAAVMFLLAACSTPLDIKQVGNELYRVTKEDQSATDGKMSELRAAALESANAFAKRQGKQVVSVQEKEIPVNRPVRGAIFEYTFRLEP